MNSDFAIFARRASATLAAVRLYTNLRRYIAPNPAIACEFAAVIENRLSAYENKDGLTPVIRLRMYEFSVRTSLIQIAQVLLESFRFGTRGTDFPACPSKQGFRANTGYAAKGFREIGNLSSSSIAQKKSEQTSANALKSSRLCCDALVDCTTSARSGLIRKTPMTDNSAMHNATSSAINSGACGTSPATAQ